MNRILLIGNPNVGKSAIFCRLTGARAIISNYPGTTVEFTSGKALIGGESVDIIDVPGTYSLEPTCRAEDVACKMLNEGGVVINVVDAANLERNLSLTLQLLERGLPVIVALNLWDEARHRGIRIETAKLESELGVPVVPTVGLTGEGIKELAGRLKEAGAVKAAGLSDSARWEKVGYIVKETQVLTCRRETALEKLEDLSIQPLTGIPLALGMVYLAFQAIRFIGEALIGFVFDPLFDGLWRPALERLSLFLGEGALLQRIMIGGLIDGQIDFGMSFGMLSTGLYVPLAMVLPYIFSFYLILGLLEDLGYLPRLAVLADNIMHRFGLHGYAIIPFILCLGCNVPGALALRVLEERREKFIAATLMTIAIPCMAQIALITGLVGERGGGYVAIVFGTLFILLVVKGLILNRLVRGVSPEILVEIPPYRMPQPRAVTFKLWMRLSGFLKEALPLVMLGVLIVNILYSLRIIDALASFFAPVLTGLWGLPKEAASALIVGFLRKDVAVGMLGPLGLSTKQLVIGSTILAVYFPCMATYAVLLRELGVKDTLKSTLIMVLAALIVGIALNMIL